MRGLLGLGLERPSLTLSPMRAMLHPMMAFTGVAFEIWIVAWGTLALLVAALLAAAANVFFRSVAGFDDHLREATMNLDPHSRRRFFKLYDSRHPKSPAVAWFLAVGLGPAGANLYRGEWLACLAAIVSLNGFGAWWLESWFTTPQLVLLKNRGFSSWALFTMEQEGGVMHDTIAPPRLVTAYPHGELVKQ